MNRTEPLGSEKLEENTPSPVVEEGAAAMSAHAARPVPHASSEKNAWGAAALMICLDGSVGPILVVGGGTTGLRKIRTLLEAGMRVRLISPDALPELAALAAEGRIAWEERLVERSDFEEHAFALLALPRRETEHILALAGGTGCLLDCCGARELGTWSLAAQFRASPSGKHLETGERGASATNPKPPVPDGDSDEYASGAASRNRGVPDSFLVGVASGGRSPGGSAALKRQLRKYLEGDIS